MVQYQLQLRKDSIFLCIPLLLLRPPFITITIITMWFYLFLKEKTVEFLLGLFFICLSSVTFNYLLVLFSSDFYFFLFLWCYHRPSGAVELFNPSSGPVSICGLMALPLNARGLEEEPRLFVQLAVREPQSFL
jgi:hypothetical protein